MTYSVILSDIDYSKHREIMDWCYDNIGQYGVDFDWDFWCNGDRIYRFTKEEYCTWFKLRWE